jgi:hypothetical protein
MFTKFKSALRSMLTDGHDENAISSKRVVTFSAFLLCCFGFLVDLFSDFTVSIELFNSMMWIVVAGLGFTASEKFSKNNPDE